MSTPTKHDDLIKLIENKFGETNKNIESIKLSFQNELSNINTNMNNHSTRIDKIESDLDAVMNDTQLDDIRLQLELIKQDRLRNNLRLTGLPPAAYESPVDTIMQIQSVLKMGLIVSDFTAYADRHKSSLIVSFSSYTLKRMFVNEMHRRKSLLVEEVFPSISSNSNIYSNDQLTPYFAKLFQQAWQAKKDGLILSASSLGGRIKVKLTETSQTTLIETEHQLTELIGNKQPNAASTQQSNGQVDPRNSDSNNKSNNESFENKSRDTQRHPNTNLSKHHNNRPDSNATHPSRMSDHHNNQFGAKRIHSRLQSDIRQQRFNSRDRAYRSDFEFEDHQHTNSNGKRNKNRFSSYNRSPSPHRRYDRNGGRFDPGNSYGRYNRHHN